MSRFDNNPEAVSAIYELIEIGCTVEDVTELFESIKAEIEEGPTEEGMDPTELDPESLN